MDDAVNPLHSYTILVILIEGCKDLEKFLIRGLWHQLNHFLQNNARALPDLGNLIFGCLGEQVDNVFLVADRQVLINHWEKLDC